MGENQCVALVEEEGCQHADAMGKTCGYQRGRNQLVLEGGIFLHHLTLPDGPKFLVATAGGVVEDLGGLEKAFLEAVHDVAQVHRLATTGSKPYSCIVGLCLFLCLVTLGDNALGKVKSLSGRRKEGTGNSLFQYTVEFLCKFVHRHLQV